MKEDIFTAVSSDNIGKIRELLDAGVDVDTRRNDGYTPLHLACNRWRRVEVVMFLLSRGADVNAADAFGDTPLHAASSSGRQDIARILLDAGANINAANNSTGTPLHHACRWGHTDTIKLLLESGADASFRNEFNYTPLEITCNIFPNKSNDQDEILELFQEYAPELYFTYFCEEKGGMGL